MEKKQISENDILFFESNKDWDIHEDDVAVTYEKFIKYDVAVFLFWKGDSVWQMKYVKDVYSKFGRREGYATAVEAYIDAMEDCIKTHL